MYDVYSRQGVSYLSGFFYLMGLVLLGLFFGSLLSGGLMGYADRPEYFHHGKGYDESANLRMPSGYFNWSVHFSFFSFLR